MSTTRTAIADGSDPLLQEAARDTNAIQNACNLYTIVGEFRRILLTLRSATVHGDDLNNHPITLAFVSKLNSLCRMTPEREMAALRTVGLMEKGEMVEYQVIPL